MTNLGRLAWVGDQFGQVSPGATPGDQLGQVGPGASPGDQFGQVGPRATPGWQTTRSSEERLKLGAIAQSISPTQPNLVVAILLQAAPLLTLPNLGDRPTLGGPRNFLWFATQVTNLGRLAWE